MLLWGSAGRVLLTLEDSLLQGDPLARYDGATLTLIFDEDSPAARGGIQSLAATADEAERLLLDAMAHFRVDLFAANKEVTVA